MITRGMVLSTIVAIPLMLTGCGDSGVVPISGTLTYKGKPITNAVVFFVPSQGRMSSGETDKQGRFSLKYDPQTQGAVLGKHKVYVEYNSLEAMSQPGAVPGVPISPPKDMLEFFDKYGVAKSQVQVDVQKAESDLKLAWD